MIKLLIIDDEKSMEELVKPFFERQGFNVFYADLGNKGLEIFKKENPDVVLLDLGLPDIDGEEVLVKMKALNKNAKVAILTGFGAEEIKDKVLPLGPDAFFTKPCKFPEILEQIKQWYNT